MNTQEQLVCLFTEQPNTFDIVLFGCFLHAVSTYNLILCTTLLRLELVTLLRSWRCAAPLSESLWLLLLLVQLLKVFHRHSQKTIVVLFCGHIFMLDSFYVFPHEQNPPCVTSAECL